jgi:AcrR family transcriptional regulator
MDAALDLLAQRGEDSVTLRALTDAAQANVAAVSYHFGSLRSLCDAAVEHALELYLDAQREAISAVSPGATLEEVAAAFAAPMINAMSEGGRDLDVMRIVARAGIDPPPGWGRFDARFVRTRTDVARLLKPRLPDTTDQELWFRTRCVAGLMNWLVLAPVGAELRDKSRAKVERQLVPVLAGCFRATTPA